VLFLFSWGDVEKFHAFQLLCASFFRNIDAAIGIFLLFCVFFLIAVVLETDKNVSLAKSCRSRWRTKAKPNLKLCLLEKAFFRRNFLKKAFPHVFSPPTTSAPSSRSWAVTRNSTAPTSSRSTSSATAGSRRRPTPVLIARRLTVATRAR